MPSLLITFLVFFITARLSSDYFRFTNTSPALIWPPAGIAFASMILRGYKMWPAIGTALIINGFLNGSNPILLAISVMGNIIQPSVGVYILKKLKFDIGIKTLKDVFIFIGTAVVVAMINSTIILIVPRLLGVTSMVTPQNWHWIWAGHTMSLFIVGSFIITWFRDNKINSTVKQLVEAVLVVGSLIVITYLITFTPINNIAGISFFYIIVLQLLWIAIRFKTRSMTLALLLITIIGIFGAVINPLDKINSLSQRLLGLEIFMIFMGGLFLILTALAEERRFIGMRLRHQMAELEATLKKIQIENESKNTFLNVLSHELRNPLAPILNSLELIDGDKKLTKKEFIGSVSLIKRQVDHMRRLLDDLLDISRITQGKITLKKEVIDVCLIINQALETVEPILKKNKHKVEVNIPSESLWLETDPLRLEQIIVNLLNNAAMYMKPMGQINLYCGKDNDHIVIRVKDMGRGISKESLPFIFSDSNTLVRSIGPTPGGLGIGLKLVKTLVELHAGRIEAFSDGLGRGSEFVVTLPARRKSDQLAIKRIKEEKEEKEIAYQPIPNIIAKNKILVVDDNYDAAYSLKKLLEKIGYKVLMAYSGPMALEVIQKYCPDTVLLDIGLSEAMDGYAVAREIRKFNRDVALIAVTGYGQEEDKRRCLEAGFNIHLTKPVGIAELRNLLGGSMPASHL